MNNNKGTICVQGGWKPTKGEPRVLPIYQSTTFKYDTSDNTVTAEGDFDKDQTAEELLRYLDRLLDTYFDTDTGEEE